jgi:probable rRNA maturation factor
MRAIYVGAWRIDIERRDGVTAPLSAAAISRTAANALDAAGAPAPASLAVILTDDAELAALNQQHMGHEGPTDVLSFPMLPAGAFPPHPGQRAGMTVRADAEFVLPPGQRQHLGDVVVSVERALEQAVAGLGGQTGDVRWSGADELRLLVTHGTLHICGWDHADADERDAMRALENDLLSEATDR